MRRALLALLFLLAAFAPLRLGASFIDHDTVANATANFTYDGAGNRIKELLNTATVPTNTTAANITAAQFASPLALTL